jgi:two-component system NtrC family sensor kinase
MDVVEEECERAARIIRELLVFARRKPPERKQVDLNEVARAALSLQAPEFDLRGVRVITELSSVPGVRGDAHQLQQVLMNLFSNAAHAMRGKPGGGQLIVRSRETDGRVVMEVEDDGPGIAPENLTRVFDPFFTTKGDEQGTGLGLSIAYGIVHRHRGTITVESEVGVGTTFTVRLPLTATRNEPSGGDVVAPAEAAGAA